MLEHRVYRMIVEAVRAGRLAEPFGREDFRAACPGLGDGTYHAFLDKHAVGNLGSNTELFERVTPGMFVLVKPVKYGI